MEKFKELVREIKRDGIEDLLVALEENNFYKAPASSGHHLAKDGGLVEHSSNVAEIALKIAETLGYENKESVLVAALFHDVGKAKYYGKDNYLENILKSGKRSEAKPYEKNKDLMGIPHEVASLHIVSRYIELTEEEAHAILFHNGMYTGLSRDLKGHETQLQMIVHFADMWASRNENI